MQRTATNRSVEFSAERSERVEKVDSVTVAVCDSVLEVTTVTIRENEQGDTLRMTTVTDRTRIRDRERVKDVQERAEVRSDTVYVQLSDSVRVQRTSLASATDRNASPLSSWKWMFWMIVAAALLVVGVKVTKMFGV